VGLTATSGAILSGIADIMDSHVCANFSPSATNTATTMDKFSLLCPFLGQLWLF